MAGLSATVAAAEIFLFSFLGRIVDWLSTRNRETFLATEGWKLAGMALVLVALLSIVTLNSNIIHQTLLGNFPQRIRWMAHRYLIRQSKSYIQDEFAGRVAAK